MSKILDLIKNVLFSADYDPLDFSRIQPPERFRSSRSVDLGKRLDDIKKELDEPFNPYKGFGESMELLGQSLNKGIEIYGGNLQPKQ